MCVCVCVCIKQLQITNTQPKLAYTIRKCIGSRDWQSRERVGFRTYMGHGLGCFPGLPWVLFTWVVMSSSSQKQRWLHKLWTSPLCNTTSQRRETSFLHGSPLRTRTFLAQQCSAYLLCEISVWLIKPSPDQSLHGGMLCAGPTWGSLTKTWQEPEKWNYLSWLQQHFSGPTEVQPLHTWLLHSTGCHRDHAHTPWWQLPWAAMFSSTLHWPPATSDWTMGILIWKPPIHWPYKAEKDESGQTVALSIWRRDYKSGPPTDESIKMVWYIQMMEYYSVIKHDKIIPFAATRMELEIIVPSEVSQKEKDKCYMIWSTCGS